MLPTADGWKPVDGRDAIEKTFVFEDFTAAWDFMSKTARVADIVSDLRILSDTCSRLCIPLRADESPPRMVQRIQPRGGHPGNP